MKQLILNLSVMVICLFVSIITINGQGIPNEYKKGTISEQLNHLETHTRIYDNFRAVREDIFQTISRNVKDTVSNAQNRINGLNFQIISLNNRIDSINRSLATSMANIDDLTQKQNSISVLGISINKTAYNSFMWSVLGIAILLMFIGYWIFKKNRIATQKAKAELTDLQKEYENYKQKKRIEIENLTMIHFNEMKKLKSGDIR